MPSSDQADFWDVGSHPGDPPQAVCHCIRSLWTTVPAGTPHSPQRLPAVVRGIPSPTGLPFLLCSPCFFSVGDGEMVIRMQTSGDRNRHTTFLRKRREQMEAFGSLCFVSETPRFRLMDTPVLVFCLPMGQVYPRASRTRTDNYSLPQVSLGLPDVGLVTKSATERNSVNREAWESSRTLLKSTWNWGYQPLPKLKFHFPKVTACYWESRMETELPKQRMCVCE